jgi:hypothetical protein
MPNVFGKATDAHDTVQPASAKRKQRSKRTSWSSSKFIIMPLTGSRKATVYLGEEEDVDAVDFEMETETPSKRLTQRQEVVVVAEEASMPTNIVRVMMLP